MSHRLAAGLLAAALVAVPALAAGPDFEAALITQVAGSNPAIP